MKWDLQDLLKKRLAIKSKIELESNSKISEYLKCELELIESMINFAAGKVVKNSETYDYWIVSEEERRKKADFLEHYLSPLSLGLNFLEYTHHLPSYIFSKHKITKEEFIKIVESFFENFEFDLMGIYKSIKEQKGVNITPTCFLDDGCTGVDIYLPTFNSSYVDAIYNGEIKHISCLPHEIGHAYQFHDLSHEDTQIMCHSVFRETFPHFVELAFFDFLKHTKYFKNAMNMELDFIDNIYSVYEITGSIYMQTHSLTSKNDMVLINEHGETIYSCDASRFISRIMAFYLIYAYRNWSNGKEFVDSFNQSFLEHKEYEFFEKIGYEKMLEALKNEFKNYYADIQKRKSFKLDRNHIQIMI